MKIEIKCPSNAHPFRQVKVGEIFVAYCGTGTYFLRTADAMDLSGRRMFNAVDILRGDVHCFSDEYMVLDLPKDAIIRVTE